MAAILNVGFVLLPAFTMTPFAALLDMLRLAADDGDGSRPRHARWRIVGARPVVSSAGVRIEPDEPIGDLSRFDYVVVCGGLLRDRGRADGRNDDDMMLSAALARARSLIGLCTASFTLADAGLLEGRRACVSWFHHAAFRAAYPGVSVSGTDLFVVDGPIVTCAGGTGAVDVGAWLIERHLGAATARKALDIMMAAENRAAQAPQPHRLAAELRDPRLRTAALLIEQRLGSPPDVALLATTIGLSPRQLSRLFVRETGLTTGAFIREARLAQSRWLMETTGHPLVQIANETGFADAAHFSNVFRQRFGVRPSRIARPARTDRAM